MALNLKIGDKVEYLGKIHEIKEFMQDGWVTEFTDGLQAHTDHLIPQPSPEDKEEERRLKTTNR